MKRAAIERGRTVRTWRAHLATHTRPVLCACDLQPGRFRKSQRVGGCGRPQCWLCHGDKLAGRLSLKQRVALTVQQEGLAEFASLTLIERTRTGMALQALISFWTLRALPARAAHVKRWATQ